MPLDLSAIAGGLEKLQGLSAKFDQTQDQQKLLQLQMLREAPEGYVPNQGPNGVELKYVGMQDPRIQNRLAQQAVQLQAESAAKLDLARQLSPLEFADREKMARLEAQIQFDAQQRVLGLKASAEFAAAVARLVDPAFARLPQPDQDALRGQLVSLGATAQALSPDIYQRTLQNLPEASRALLGAALQAKPTAPAAAFRAPGATEFPPVSPYSPKPSAPVGSPTQVPTPAATPAAYGVEAAQADIASLVAAGKSDAEIMSGVFGKLSRSQAALRAFDRPAMTEGQVQGYIQDTLQAERNKGTAAQNAGGPEAEAAAPRFQAGISAPAGSGDQTAPLLSSLETDPKTGLQRQAYKANEAAMATALTGDAAPLARIHDQAVAQNLSFAAAKKLIGPTFGAIAAESLKPLDPKRAKDILILTPPARLPAQPRHEGQPVAQPEIQATVEVDPEGRLRFLLPGTAPSATNEAGAVGRMAANAADFFGAGVPEGGRLTPEGSVVGSGLTPEGLARVAWTAATAETEGDPPPRFIWVNVPTRQLPADAVRRIAVTNQQVWKAMGRKPAATGGVWLDVNALIGGR